MADGKGVDMFGSILGGVVSGLGAVLGFKGQQNQSELVEEQMQLQEDMQEAAFEENKRNRKYAAKMSLFDAKEGQRKSFIYIAIGLVLFVIIALIFIDKE